MASRAESNGSPRVSKPLPVLGKHLATPSAAAATPRLSTTNGTAAFAALDQLRICSEYTDPRRVYELRHAVYGALTLAEQYRKSVDRSIIDTARKRLASAADFNELFQIASELESEQHTTSATRTHCEATQLAAAAAFLVYQTKALKARETWFIEAAQTLCLQAQTIAQNAAGQDTVIPELEMPRARRSIPKPTPFKLKGEVQPLTCALRLAPSHLLSSVPRPVLREPTPIPSFVGRKKLPMPVPLSSPLARGSGLSPIQRHCSLVKPQRPGCSTVRPGLTVATNRQVRC